MSDGKYIQKLLGTSPAEDHNCKQNTKSYKFSHISESKKKLIPR
jgi:hypothetical protein